jgi:IclR family pca regulon transcriptional regulator
MPQLGSNDVARHAEQRATPQPEAPTNVVEASKKNDRELITSLARGIDVIRAFGADKPALALVDVARITGLSPATARRCLRTLEVLGYVGRRDKRFMLKPRVLELAASYLNSISIEELCRSHLQEVVTQTEDSSSLCVLDGDDIVYLAHVATKRLFRIEASVGARYPAYPTSMGRVLLAHLPPERLERYLNETRFVALTDRTETDPVRLRAHIEAAGRDDYAAVEDELAYGVVAIAVPVFDTQGVCVAAINCSAHSKEINKAALVAQRLTLLRATACKITASLRHFPALSDSIRA